MSSEEKDRRFKEVNQIINDHGTYGNFVIEKKLNPSDFNLSSDYNGRVYQAYLQVGNRLQTPYQPPPASAIAAPLKPMGGRGPIIEPVNQTVLLITSHTEFQSSGRAKLLAAKTGKTKITMEDGFAKDISIYEERECNPSEEDRIARLRDVKGMLIRSMANALLKRESFEGVPLNEVTKKATDGNVRAQQMLGRIYDPRMPVVYDSGTAITKNAASALEWYTTAARSGDMEAQYNLGYIYSHGGCGATPNDDEAVKWYRMAANQGQQGAKEWVDLHEKNFGMNLYPDDLDIYLIQWIRFLSDSEISGRIRRFPPRPESGGFCSGCAPRFPQTPLRKTAALMPPRIRACHSA
jgi:hypothetical protein